MSKIT